MRSTFPLLALVVASLCNATSTAQESSQWLERDPQSTFPISPPEAPHRHSSTALEGYLRGLAALTRAQADYMIAEGQAGILWEQIEAMDMRNFMDRARYHFEWKKLMANERHQARIDRMVRTEEMYLVREWQKSRKEMREALKNPLSEFDVNFNTGMIYWPSLLASPRYAHYRQELEKLTSEVLTGNVYKSRQTSERLAKVCQEFRDSLRKDLQIYQGSATATEQAQFDAAQRLLKGLRYTPVVMARS